MRHLACVALCGLAFGLGAASASADIILLDFGSQGQTVFTGTFDGSTGFQEASVTNGPSNMTFDLGSGRTLAFTQVGAWNLPNDGAGDPSSLTNDFIYSAGMGPAANPVPFTLSGVLASETVTLELVGSVQWGADVTFGSSVTTTVPQAASSFTVVGIRSGFTSYDGTFTSVGGGGEGNLAGARITIETIPEPGTAACMLLGLGLCAVLRRRLA